MYILVIALIILASVLMCGIVLIQESKGGGLASSFSAQNNVLGVRKTTDFLEKATWTLAVAMVILSVVSAAFVPKVNTEEAPINVVVPSQQTDANNVQSFPAAAPSTDAASTEKAK
ncbi:MAG: preprotein translocase subunit SecG [Bacteroidaceae bacterium]|nr:preprotein translocase subunit SecG [Bacteroidaceae bacterium]